MLPLLQRFGGWLVQRWRSLGRGQRLGIVGLTTGLLALWFLVQILIRPASVPVFTRLTDTDAAAVSAKLKESKIPFELADGGATIRVTGSRAAEARLAAASAGLPKNGSTGFEIFDRPSFGLTDFNQRVTFQRALEGELGRTIGQMRAVEQARVHLVLPKNELFLDREKPATASVVVKVRPGLRLEGEAIRSIATLVSGSVEGLAAENVAIVDTDGNALWNEREGGGSTSRLSAQGRYEHEIESKLRGLLDPMVGPGKSLVRVSASIDWDQVKVNRDTVTPGGVRTLRETADRNPSNGQVESRETTTTFDLGRSSETIVRAPGTVKRLTVAIVIDQAVPSATAGQIRQVVESAAGIEGARGDLVTITSVPLVSADDTPRPPAIEATTIIEPVVPLASLLVVVLAFAALAFLRRLARRPAPSRSPSDPVPALVAQATGPFAFTNQLSPNTLIAALGDEHPQLWALVLANVPSPLAAATLSGLEPAQRADVVARIAALEPAPTETIEAVARVLRQRIAGRDQVAARGTESLAAILRQSAPVERRAILDALDPNLAERVVLEATGPAPSFGSRARES